MKGSFLHAYITWVRRILPSPLSIALVLTLVTAGIVAIVYDAPSESESFPLISWWVEGLWEPDLLVFAVQMMLMLVLGHVLALSPWVARGIHLIVKHCSTSARSAAIVALSTLCVGLFNWGLGLIFGAILARKVGEKAKQEGKAINYPLIGAAGYAALMIWHGGMSGSSLIKIAEPGHLNSLMGNTFNGSLPDVIPLGDTVFSGMNLVVTLALLICIPFILYLIGKKTEGDIPTVEPHVFEAEDTSKLVGAEKLDRSGLFSKSFGVLIIGYVVVQMWQTGFLNYFTPNHINLLLLGLCFASHAHVHAFTQGLERAIQGASGILIQFPLYFGILALMKQSGLVDQLSAFFIQYSTDHTYPLLTFFSAGLVNLFVPSGGGQWAIQGPIILQSSMELGVPLEKSILAMAYGDEITNMLQPFWALPLLGITRLSAKDILPYTLAMFVTGSVIFTIALLVF